MSLFSIPSYPSATGYNIYYSDPTSGDPNAPNPFGPWTPLTGSPLASTSNIYDSSGDQSLRLYRAQPIISVLTANSGQQSITLPMYDPFSVAMSSPGSFIKSAQLYDPQITALLQSFRDFIGDNGVPQTASTSINLDSGAGSGLLQPNGSQTVFNLADMPDAVPVVILESSVTVQQNGVTKLGNTDYYVKYDAGQIVFKTAPLSTDAIDVFYTEVRYTNRVLNAAIANAIQRLAGLGINGYGISLDQNVTLVSAALNSPGLLYIIFLAAQTILNQAVIWAKAAEARSYKTADFSMDTAPARILDGMSNQTKVDNDNIKDAVDKYIRTATRPIVWGDWDSFLDMNGLLPNFQALFLLSPYSYWI